MAAAQRRRVVVAGTGSASGQAVCRALRDAGHEVVLAGRDEVDLASFADVQRFSREVLAGGGVDALVHLVGGWRGGKGLAGQSDEDWEWLRERVIDTLRNTTRAFHDALAESAGVLVVVSTTGLERPTAGNANYLAAKAGAEAWTHAVGQSLGKSGGRAEVLRVMALLTDEQQAAEPDKDWSRFTHVDELAARILAFVP